MDPTACPVHGVWPLGGKFCPQCGVPMVSANPNCPACDKLIEPVGANFCRHCAEDLRPTPKPGPLPSEGVAI